MDKNSNAIKDELRKQVEEIISLTDDTCDMCGGTFEENLNGAIAYFTVGKKRYKMEIKSI